MCIRDRSYNTLPVYAQRLFVRLVLRTSAYLRLSKINYAEIDVPPALEHLGKTGFVNPDINSIELCLPLFTLQESSTALGVNSTELPAIDSEIWTTPDLFGDSPIAKLFSADNVIGVNYKETIHTFLSLIHISEPTRPY